MSFEARRAVPNLPPHGELDAAQGRALEPSRQLDGRAADAGAHQLAARRQAGGDRRRERVVGVQHGVLEARHREQLALRLAVALEIAVLVEMIAREIREHGRVEREAGDALLIQRMRRHFHRDARRAELRELAMQSQAVRRRQRVRRERGGTP